MVRFYYVIVDQKMESETLELSWSGKKILYSVSRMTVLSQK